jgi:hypothetical protein
MQSRKFIKKIIQLTVITLLVFFALPATAFLLLQSNKIQNHILNRVMRVISQELDTKCSIGNIDISFLYRIRLHDVYLEDLSGDTLLFVRSLTAGIRMINPANQTISIGSLNFDNALVSLAIDSASTLNLNYFIKKLQRNGEKKEGWKVDFRNLTLRDSRFQLKNFYSTPVKSGVNYTDIRLSGIDADIKRFSPGRDSLSFFIKSLKFNEASGFILKNLSADFSQGKTFMSFRDIQIKTQDSEIAGDEISFRFNSWSSFKADSFFYHVNLRTDISRSVINLRDIGYFATVFYQTNQEVRLSGLVTGPVGNLKCRRLEFNFGDKSRITGEVNMEGLPNIRETFILANIKELSVTSSDIQSLQLPGQTKINFPHQLDKIGLVTFKGNFTGFINDFVTYGRFETDLGVIDTDLLLRPDTLSYINFEGKLNARDFDLGTLLDASKNLGKISLSATVNGSTHRGKSINAALKILVQKFEFRQYEYTNLVLSGNLANKTFDGSVNIKDPNIDLEFLGKLNLSDSIPVFDFTANITDANFYALNISKSDPDFKASCYLIANAHGNSLNTLNGEVKLLNSLFSRKDKQLQVYDISILAENTLQSNQIHIRSDFVDADLTGTYKITQLYESIAQFIYSYLPSLSDSASAIPLSLKDQLRLKVAIKHAKPLFEFFLPDYGIADNSLLDIDYKPASQAAKITVTSPWIKAKDIVWNGFSSVIDCNGKTLDFEAGGKDFIYGNRIKLENFTVLSTAGNDSASVGIRWNNWQDLQYRGNIKAMARISRHTINRYPHIAIDVLSSQIITNDTIWAIQPGTIAIDSSNIRFNHVEISHGDEYLALNGALSENQEEELNLNFYRFNLGQLNGLTMPSGFKIGGVLNGKATFSDVYSDILFISLLKADSLIINDEMLGSTEISSKWDDNRKAIELEVSAMRNNLKTIAVEGEYIPMQQDKLDFNIELDKLRLNLFNPYVKTIFGDLRGMASGKATLTGTFSKPLLNGEFNLQKTNFTVNYLQTRYNFTEKVQIENNNIYFKDIRIYDPKGNSAYLSGAIRNRYLKDFQIDLTIRSEDFLCMNTTAADNSMFYGTAYGSGVIKISGPPKNIVMDVSATTSKNTSISIPLSDEGKLGEYQFITINKISDDNEPEKAETDYQVNLSGMQINLDLTVTPDAEVQIIFDPKLGDIIKGKGNANLDMKINTAGSFLMYGEYVIEEGDYLFTLQNIINKKLNIESGGTIKWSGDPLDASIDIVAYYRTRAALNDLLGTSDERNIKFIVDDRVTMTGRLMAPDVKYDIYLPNADEGTQLSVKSAISTSDELNRQFISILTLNRFMPSSSRAGQAQSSLSASPYSNAAGVNASEFLSNQLSHWLSQINNDWDVGINYRSDRELKSEEIQVALSTQLFNDRLNLTVNGSVDVATNAAVKASDNIVGEFDIDYKITRNGKFRIKTYNHINNDMLYENSPYTQGLGVLYKEEFNTFGELWRRYMRSLFGKKEDDVVPEVLQEPDPDS